MFRKPRLHFAAILLAYLCAQETFAAPTQDMQQIKLAVLKLTFIEISLAEQELIRTTLYENLMKDERITLMTEAQVRKELVSLGIDPAGLDDEADYMRTAQALRVDYVLVGKFDNIGGFVLTTFTVFPSPKGTQGQYEGGKILDMLKQEGIPELIKSMTPTLAKQQPDTIIIEPPPPKTVESKKRPKWRLIALGGTAVGGVVTAVLLSSRGGSKETAVNEGLPRPPKTP